MYSESLIKHYAYVLRISFSGGESGNAIAIESVERHSDLALETLKHLEQCMRSGEISIEEADAEQLLDFIETTYRLCVHQEGAPYHRRNLEEWMWKLAADKEAKAS